MHHISLFVYVLNECVNLFVASQCHDIAATAPWEGKSIQQDSHPIDHQYLPNPL